MELPVTGAHAVAVDLLPPIHKDPFDRILVAQAQIEGITLLTADEVVARYPGPIRAFRVTPPLLRNCTVTECCWQQSRHGIASLL